MTQGQQETVLFHCPRCGGPMRKPSGSTLYWHATTNHPRCDITNIHERVLEVEARPSATSAKQPAQPGAQAAPTPRQRKKETRQPPAPRETDREK
jgi:ssDNA-binding Zn-finger/Zn-ribbon topoisomerase 1